MLLSFLHHAIFVFTFCLCLSLSFHLLTETPLKVDTKAAFTAINKTTSTTVKHFTVLCTCVFEKFKHVFPPNVFSMI